MSRQFKAKLAQLPRAGLLAGSTALEPMARLSAHIGGPNIWVKREDQTGLGFGGNKLRKLDFVLADALAQGADTLVSCGVVQSNSQRQVAAAAAKLGLACHLAVYHGRVANTGMGYETSGNALLNRLYGATLHDVPWTGDRSDFVEGLAEDLRSEGKRPYVVPYGVSNALGAAGYASAIVELEAQCAEMDIRPRAIVFCSGSGGTQAGLAVGASLCLPDTEVVGIDIDAEPARVRGDVQRYAADAAALLEVSFDTDRIEVVAGMAGPAYGVPHQATIDALKLAARSEALILDPVYSAKGLAGLIALIREGRWQAGQDIIFLHTGGAPALFAYREALQV